MKSISYKRHRFPPEVVQLPRNYALDDNRITEILHNQVAIAFEEDRLIIESQAANIRRLGGFETDAIPADLALLHVRKLMSQRPRLTLS